MLSAMVALGDDIAATIMRFIVEMDHIEVMKELQARRFHVVMGCVLTDKAVHTELQRLEDLPSQYIMNNVYVIEDYYTRVVTSTTGRAILVERHMSWVDFADEFGLFECE